MKNFSPTNFLSPLHVLLLFMVSISSFVIAQEDSVITINNYKIHPNSFRYNSFKTISRNESGYALAAKSINHLFFAIAEVDSALHKKISIYSRKGKLQYAITDNDPYSVNYIFLSSNGDIVHLVTQIPFYEQIGFIIKTYKQGKLIYKTDSVNTYVFNHDGNIIFFNKENDMGCLFYLNIETGFSWKNNFSSSVLYPSGISIDGKNVVGYSPDRKLYFINENGSLKCIMHLDTIDGNIIYSDYCEHLLIRTPFKVDVYELQNCKLILSLNSYEITKDSSSLIGDVNCLDKKGLIFISTKTGLKVFDLKGKHKTNLSLNFFNSEFEMIDKNDKIEIIKDGNFYKLLSYPALFNN